MTKKAVVLGLDGLEPSIVESMVARGELPNFRTLQARGSYQRLQTTYPAQTPVAWSTFVTGVNPGAHGVFDFICRDPKTYRPDLALSRFEPPRNRFSQPRAVSRRRGYPLWQVLQGAGVPSTILRCPCTFSPDDSGARILAGMGVPDIRGGQGTGTFYTQDKTVSSRENEQVVHLEGGDGLKSYFIGPRDTRQAPARDVTAELKIRAALSGRSLQFEVADPPALIEVAENTWSPWVRVRFKFSRFQSVSSLARLFVCRLSPHIEFYVCPLNFDPSTPLFPISSPGTYAQELADRIGLYATTGMAEDHNGNNNGRLDDAAFAAQCELVFKERERMLFFELDRLSEGFLFVLFDTPDRMQHMFWRGRDREHPRFDPAQTNSECRVEDAYRSCDRLLGRVMDRVDEDTLLIALSDHGFGNFRRALDINSWLWQQGLLKLRDHHRPDEEVGNGFAAVDWSRTYAYAIGLGGIYLNIRGREAGGILDEGGEADRVRRAIETGLPATIDPKRQERVAASVSRREQIYSGAYVNEAPDLLVNFRPGFRVAWENGMGGFAPALLQDNDRRWSGDHLVDPAAVPGVLFMNRSPRHERRARIEDLAPSILSHFNLPPHAVMEGISLV